MNAQRWKALVALALMTAALSAAIVWQPTSRLVDTESKLNLEVLFPKQFGDWSVDTHVPLQLVAPDTQAALNKIYDQTLSRTYVNSRGDRVMLSVAYGGDQSDATRAHRPEVCYPAQGFQVASQDQSSIALPDLSLPVHRLIARQNERNEPITYWIVVGRRVAVSGTEQKLAQLSYGMRGVIPDGMLVRVSTIDMNAKRAYQVQADFIVAITSAIDPARRERVVGQLGMTVAEPHS